MQPARQTVYRHEGCSKCGARRIEDIYYSYPDDKNAPTDRRGDVDDGWLAIVPPSLSSSGSKRKHSSTSRSHFASANTAPSVTDDLIIDVENIPTSTPVIVTNDQPVAQTDVSTRKTKKRRKSAPPKKPRVSRSPTPILDKPKLDFRSSTKRVTNTPVRLRDGPGGGGGGGSSNRTEDLQKTPRMRGEANVRVSVNSNGPGSGWMRPNAPEPLHRAKTLVITGMENIPDPSSPTARKLSRKSSTRTSVSSNAAKSVESVDLIQSSSESIYLGPSPPKMGLEVGGDDDEEPENGRPVLEHERDGVMSPLLGTKADSLARDAVENEEEGEYVDGAENADEVEIVEEDIDMTMLPTGMTAGGVGQNLTKNVEVVDLTWSLPESDASQSVDGSTGVNQSPINATGQRRSSQLSTSLEESDSPIFSLRTREALSMQTERKSKSAQAQQSATPISLGGADGQYSPSPQPKPAEVSKNFDLVMQSLPSPSSQLTSHTTSQPSTPIRDTRGHGILTSSPLSAPYAPLPLPSIHDFHYQGGFTVPQLGSWFDCDSSEDEEEVCAAEEEHAAFAPFVDAVADRRSLDVEIGANDRCSGDGGTGSDLEGDNNEEERSTQLVGEVNRQRDDGRDGGEEREADRDNNPLETYCARGNPSDFMSSSQELLCDESDFRRVSSMRAFRHEPLSPGAMSEGSDDASNPDNPGMLSSDDLAKIALKRDELRHGCEEDGICMRARENADLPTNRTEPEDGHQSGRSSPLEPLTPLSIHSDSTVADEELLETYADKADAVSGARETTKAGHSPQAMMEGKELLETHTEIADAIGGPPGAAKDDTVPQATMADQGILETHVERADAVSGLPGTTQEYPSPEILLVAHDKGADVEEPLDNGTFESEEVCLGNDSLQRHTTDESLVEQAEQVVTTVEVAGIKLSQEQSLKELLSVVNNKSGANIGCGADEDTGKGVGDFDDKEEERHETMAEIPPGAFMVDRENRDGEGEQEVTGAGRHSLQDADEVKTGRDMEVLTALGLDGGVPEEIVNGDNALGAGSEVVWQNREEMARISTPTVAPDSGPVMRADGTPPNQHFIPGDHSQTYDFGMSTQFLAEVPLTCPRSLPEKEIHQMEGKPGLNEADMQRPTHDQCEERQADIDEDKYDSLEITPSFCRILDGDFDTGKAPAAEEQKSPAPNGQRIVQTFERASGGSILVSEDALQTGLRLVEDEEKQGLAKASAIPSAVGLKRNAGVRASLLASKGLADLAVEAGGKRKHARIGSLGPRRPPGSGGRGVFKPPTPRKQTSFPIADQTLVAGQSGSTNIRKHGGFSTGAGAPLREPSDAAYKAAQGLMEMGERTELREPPDAGAEGRSEKDERLETFGSATSEALPVPPDDCISKAAPCQVDLAVNSRGLVEFGNPNEEGWPSPGTGSPLKFAGFTSGRGTALASPSKLAMKRAAALLEANDDDGDSKLGNPRASLNGFTSGAGKLLPKPSLAARERASKLMDESRELNPHESLEDANHVNSIADHVHPLPAIGGFTTGKGRPLPKPSESSVKKTRALFEHTDGLSDSISLLGGFSSGKGRPLPRPSAGAQRQVAGILAVGDNSDVSPSEEPTPAPATFGGFSSGKGRPLPKPSAAAQRQAAGILALEDSSNIPALEEPSPAPATFGGFSSGKGRPLPKPSPAAHRQAAGILALGDTFNAPSEEPLPAPATKPATFRGFSSGKGRPLPKPSAAAQRQAAGILTIGDDSNSTLKEAFALEPTILGGFSSGKGRPLPKPSAAAERQAVSILAIREGANDMPAAMVTEPVAFGRFPSGKGNPLPSPSVAAQQKAADIMATPNAQDPGFEPQSPASSNPPPTLAGFSSGKGKPLPSPSEDARRKAAIVMLSDGGETEQQHLGGGVVGGGFTSASGRSLSKVSEDAIRQAASLFGAEGIPAVNENSRTHAGDENTPVIEEIPDLGLASKPTEQYAIPELLRAGNALFSNGADDVGTVKPTIEMSPLRPIQVSPYDSFRTPPRQLARGLSDFGFGTPMSAPRSMVAQRKAPGSALRGRLADKTPRGKRLHQNAKFTPIKQDAAKKGLPKMDLTPVFDLKGANVKLVEENWVENHYGWILWKLAGMVRCDPSLYSTRWNTDVVLDQLRYRYEREINQAHRSALKAVIERDNVPSRFMVLCVSDIVESSGDKAPSDKPAGANGEALSQQQTEPGGEEGYGKVRNYGSVLIGPGDPCPALEVSAATQLRLCANGTRRAKWDAKLGYQRKPCFGLGIKQLVPNGGMVPYVDVIFVRRYPMQYMEKLADGTKVTRNEKEEAAAAKEWQHQFVQLYQKYAAEIEKEKSSSKSHVQKGVFKRPRQGAQIAQLTDGEDLYQEMMRWKDPSEFMQMLNSEQLCAVQERTRLEAELEAAGTNDEIRSRLEVELPEREVIPLMRIRVCDYPPESVTQDQTHEATLTIWRPDAGLLESLVEGKRFKVYNVNVKDSRNKRFAVELNSQRMTRYVGLPIAEDRLLESLYEPRKLCHCSDLQSLEKGEEIDVVVVVVDADDIRVRYTNPKTNITIFGRNLLCTDESGTLVTIDVRTMLRSSIDFESRAIICLRNSEYSYHDYAFNVYKLKAAASAELGTSPRSASERQRKESLALWLSQESEEFEHLVVNSRGILHSMSHYAGAPNTTPFKTPNRWVPPQRPFTRASESPANPNPLGGQRFHICDSPPPRFSLELHGVRQVGSTDANIAPPLNAAVPSVDTKLEVAGHLAPFHVITEATECGAIVLRTEAAQINRRGRAYERMKPAYVVSDIDDGSAIWAVRMKFEEFTEVIRLSGVLECGEEVTVPPWHSLCELLSMRKALGQGHSGQEDGDDASSSFSALAALADFRRLRLKNWGFGTGVEPANIISRALGNALVVSETRIDEIFSASPRTHGTTKLSSDSPSSFDPTAEEELNVFYRDLLSAFDIAVEDEPIVFGAREWEAFCRELSNLVCMTALQFELSLDHSRPDRYMVQKLEGRSFKSATMALLDDLSRDVL
ncbi:Breast cancer 2, early onset [Borealophlyctis nickersoniae]|nr:Breast cancer 2, early onset [Borealophlyctis nickersoniae]